MPVLQLTHVSLTRKSCCHSLHAMLTLCSIGQLSERGSAGCKVLEQGVTCFMQTIQRHSLKERDIIRGREAASSLLQAREPSKWLESCPGRALRDTAISCTCSSSAAS